MKQLMVALAVSAMTVVGFADEQDWFTAGFGESAESVGGNWAGEEFGVAAAPRWDDATLVLPSAAEPVVFRANESKSAGDDTYVIFNTKIGFTFCKELPDIENGAKTGICSLKGGNFFVVGYDGEGLTNKWIDTGYAGVEGDVLVSLKVDGGTATYTIGSDTFGVNLENVVKDFAEVHYFGTGTVTRLDADYSSYMVDIDLSSVAIEGLTATSEVSRAEVGATVEVWFINGEKASSDPKTRYKFVVRGDGSLEIVPGQGELPTATDATASVNGEFYPSLEAALEAAGSGDTIDILSDMTNRNSVLGKTCTINANGNLVSFYGEVSITGDVALVCSGDKTEGGFRFEPDPDDWTTTQAYISIAAGKTLDMSGLSFDEGLQILEGCHFNLGMGAVVIVGNDGWDVSVWDDMPWWGCSSDAELKRTINDTVAIFTVVPAGTYWVHYHDATVTNGVNEFGVTEFTADTPAFALPAEADVEIPENMLFVGWTNYAGTVATNVDPKAMAPYLKDLDFYAVWESLYKVVTFSTNGVENVVAMTNIYKGTELTEAEIPEIFGTLKGAWDVAPTGAVIVCDTNFNFTIQVKGWEEAESAGDDATASDVWGDAVPAAIADANAKELAAWAKEQGVAFEDIGTVMPDAFLLNCANDAGAIALALEDFRFVKVIPGETPVEDWFGDDFTHNGTLTILGSDDLENWVEAKAAHHFFKGVLSF